MSWHKITCEERDRIYGLYAPRELVPLSSCTDMSGELHDGEPQMDITWGTLSPETPVLRETRYPSRADGPDRQPCEHWAYQEEG
jgi:hypothetical protein